MMYMNNFRHYMLDNMFHTKNNFTEFKNIHLNMM
jgi:hypothetical protein